MAAVVVGIDQFGNGVQVFAVAEVRATVAALSALLGMGFGGIAIQWWRHRKPVEFVVPLLCGFIFAFVIPQGLRFVPTTRPLPEGIAFVVAALTIVAPLVWAWGFWPVVYRAVAERYWACRDKKHGDVWSIEKLPDGSTRTHPPRVRRPDDIRESVRKTLADDAQQRRTNKTVHTA